MAKLVRNRWLLTALVVVAGIVAYVVRDYQTARPKLTCRSGPDEWQWSPTPTSLLGNMSRWPNPCDQGSGFRCHCGGVTCVAMNRAAETLLEGRHEMRISVDCVGNEPAGH